MPGPPPKPGAIRRNKPTLGEWVDLPIEGRKGPAPPLPKWRTWSPELIKLWREWWSSPQATQWDPSGRSMYLWALLYDRLLTDPEFPITGVARIKQEENDHGFSRRAMLQLRWRIVRDEVGDKRTERSTPARSVSAETRAMADRLKRVK